MIISEEEKEITAYHEAGHAIIAALEDEADPLHKVSIIPRGMALGVTQQLPIDDKYTYSKEYLEAQLSVLLAGRISEKLFLNKETSGAGNDFERASSIARKMVCEWGMSDLGPLSYGSKDEPVFLGREFAQRSDYSEATQVRIDRDAAFVLHVGLGDRRAVDLGLEHRSLHRGGSSSDRCGCSMRLSMSRTVTPSGRDGRMNTARARSAGPSSCAGAGARESGSRSSA